MTEGNTPTEKYLQQLGKKTFLSLWSYPNPHRPDGPRSKEICDLLVVFPPHIIIFSDKSCEFPKTDAISLGWSRWFRRAISDSMRQLHAAERYIRRSPDKIFVDNKCNVPLPINLPEIEKAKFHHIVVAHDPFHACERYFGNNSSSTLLINNYLKGDDHPADPFVVGDLDPKGSFVHVLNADSLELLLSVRDTISDFVDYLADKEAFLRSDFHVMATGEEEILEAHLDSYSPKKKKYVLSEHPSFKGKSAIYLPEGNWVNFSRSRKFSAMVEANRDSYFWDWLIERFVSHARDGTQHYSSHYSLRETELIYRVMASEKRVARRALSNALLNLAATTPKEKRSLRVVTPSVGGQPYYALLAFPYLPFFDSYDQYRAVRLEFLRACCAVTKIRFPSVNSVLGIATESDIAKTRRSEDALYLDTSEWTAERQAEAEELQRRLEILTTEQAFAFTDSEFPVGPRTDMGYATLSVPGRNDPCPCGSGKKYKKCHGDPSRRNR